MSIADRFDAAAQGPRKSCADAGHVTCAWLACSLYRESSEVLNRFRVFLFCDINIVHNYVYVLMSVSITVRNITTILVNIPIKAITYSKQTNYITY